MEFKNEITVSADKRVDKKTVAQLLEGFCKKSCKAEVIDGTDNIIRAGTSKTPDIAPDSEYSVLVNDNGFCVRGNDLGGLMRGLFAVLMELRYRMADDGEAYFTAAPCEFQSHYKIKRRMLHLCIFPETDKLFLHKMIRLAGILQYTHIILEFWGTLAFDCLGALSWKEAMSKAEAKKYIDEIRAFGMEPVPMFNQLGHASLSRVSYGKHVVLDQDPTKQLYFTPDGWSWNVENPKTKQLLREVRRELYELFGEGEYIHIGFDESHNYIKNEELYDTLAKWTEELTSEVVAEGRRPLMWMDMFLEHDRYPDYYTCFAPSQSFAEEMLKSVSKKTVACDWQYGVTAAPIKTALDLNAKGFDVVGTSWLDKGNIEAWAKTVCDNGLYGIMVTTWDTLDRHIRSLIFAADAFGAVLSRELADNWNCMTATLLRNIMFEDYGYADAGFVKSQL